MKKIVLFLSLFISFFYTAVFAADPNIKEETVTLPAPAGPLTANQIPPLDATGKPLKENSITTITPTTQPSEKTP